MFVLYLLNIRISYPVYNIISRAEKGGRLHLKGSASMPKKVTQQVERKIIKNVYDSSQSSSKLDSSGGKRFRVTCF